MNGLLTYSIVQLDASHLEEICEDIREQYEKGIARYPLFCTKLVPEGNPPVDKAAIQAADFALFRDRLHQMGLPCGILVQCTIGHGYPLNFPSPFRRYKNLNDGDEISTVCPSDGDFRAYIKNAMRTLAAAAPDVMMVDDDFRLLFRGGNGCACSWHMARFNELARTSLTREELFAHLEKENDGEYADIYVKTQGEPILAAARAMREGINEANPSLPCAYCAAGNNVEFGTEIAEILAGEGNPTVVRISNGTYVPAGTRNFTKDFYRAAAQIAHLKGKVTHILAESDSCPQNRYAMSASWFHSHYVGTILEGTVGAKHWITRLSAHEMQSGKAYRKILAENAGLYEELARITPTLSYRGCRIPLHPKKTFYFSKNGWDSQSDGGEGWATHVLERMGLPLYFSNQNGGVSFFSGKTDKKYTLDEWKDVLKHPTVLTSEVAKRLCDRGLSELLGVTVREWTGKRFSADLIHATGERSAAQLRSLELVPLSPAVRALSTAQHTVDGKNYESIFPSSTVYDNPLGGKSIVFAGDPVTEYTYDQAFSFFTYSRKEQLVALLRESGELPVYYPDDAEVYLKAADMADGRLFCALFNLGYDVLDEIPLIAEKPVTRVEILTPDGKTVPCPFRTEGDRTVVEKSALPLLPVILFLS